MIEIKHPDDLAQLKSSIIRKVEFLNNPARISIEIDGSDEHRYILLKSPTYAWIDDATHTINIAIGSSVNKQE